MPSIAFRPFRNNDPPHLVRLWNAALPSLGVARPLAVHEFDSIVTGPAHFEREGLIVAEDPQGPVGFVHAGFGPPIPEGPGLVLSRETGTIAMLVLDPTLGTTPPPWTKELVRRAEVYLRSRGAGVFYAGGLYPLNPFYWGVYGGSQFAGVLSGHHHFDQVVRSCGYVPMATNVLLEADLGAPEARDPKMVLLKRKVKLEIVEDPFQPHWWNNLSLAPFRVEEFRLVVKLDMQKVAEATIWDMEAHGRIDGKSRVGLTDLYVAPDHRRQGLGRFLVAEIMRHVRMQLVDRLVVQTGATNAPALALYEGLGFKRVEKSTCYRLPSDLGARSLVP